jgi:Mg-chelatase subunit ChlD
MTTKSTKHKGMDVYILLDRTGSMAPLWDEAVSSVNAYVNELVKDGAKDHITLAVFDAFGEGMQYDVLRNAVPIADWNNVAVDEVTPRGMTPLLDALVRIITRAEEVGNEKTAIVVMTDGAENASKEVTTEAAKAALDRVKAKNWQVNFLGANFDGFAQAAHLGVDHGMRMNFYVGCAGSAMAATADAHRSYRNTARQASYSKQNRENAKEDEVK